MIPFYLDLEFFLFLFSFFGNTEMALISLISVTSRTYPGIYLHLLVQQLSQMAIRSSMAGHHSVLSISFISKSHKTGLFPCFLHEVMQDLGANGINVSKL